MLNTHLLFFHPRSELVIGQKLCNTNSVFDFRFRMAVLASLILFGVLVIPVTILGQAADEDPAGDAPDAWTDFWVVRLTLNLLGYATIFVPGFLLIQYLRKIKYNETAGESLKHYPTPSFPPNPKQKTFLKW